MERNAVHFSAALRRLPHDWSWASRIGHLTWKASCCLPQEHRCHTEVCKWSPTKYGYCNFKKLTCMQSYNLLLSPYWPNYSLWMYWSILNPGRPCSWLIDKLCFDKFSLTRLSPMFWRGIVSWVGREDPVSTGIRPSPIVVYNWSDIFLNLYEFKYL